MTKVNPSGSDLIYSTFLGGSYDEWGNAIAVDGTGSAYITGRSQSSDFPTTAGAFDASLDGSDDALLAKVNADGTGLACATFLGGSGWDGGYGIAVDGSGAAYVTGRTDSSDFPTTPGAFDTSLDGDTDAFVAKLAVGSGPGLTPVVSTLTPDLSPEDPLHQVILKGSVDPRGGTVQVWFEWGSDPDLTTYQITGTQTVSGSPVTVTATISVPLGVKHFYRIASSDLGGEIVNFTILLGDPKAVSNPIWSTYDRLIEAYAAQYNIPATVLKAVMVQESSLNKSAFRYEPIPMRKIRDEIKPHLLPYMLPGHPPSENEFYPREYRRDTPWQDNTPTVRLPSDITMGALWNGYSDRISMSRPSAENWGERAQWRLTSSYGLGQLVYVYQGDKINWDRPEAFYDPYTNTVATARNLANSTCQGDFTDFPLEGLSRSVLHHNWGPLPCQYASVEALRAACQGLWCSRPDLWQGDRPAYLIQVANRIPKVRPILVQGADTQNILPPPVGTSETPLSSASALAAGEIELDRLIGDLKRTGQSQLAVLYGIGDGSGMEGVLRVFADTEGNALEWESPPMPGVTSMGTIYTQTLSVGGAPLIVAS
ncbi:MAG: hypothetical protein DRI52_08135, partial [Chloroflexi bacterium]